MRPKCADPLREYQPIVRNLKNMALRNRNFITTDKAKMPCLNAEPLSNRQPGQTAAPESPQSPKSPLRKKFFLKYIEDSQPRPQTGKPGESTSARIRNMVYANKEERAKEKEVCKYITSKVLNQGNLSKIIGITTMKDLED